MKCVVRTERRPDRWNPKNPPTREEMWLLQEDFWVKKDMLEIVRAVLDDTARMKQTYRLSPETFADLKKADADL